MLFSWRLCKSSLGLIGYDDVWAIPSLLKILFLLFEMFSWFCNSYNILVTFFFKFFTNNMLSVYFIYSTGNKEQRKTYATTETREEEIRKEIAQKVRTFYSSSNSAISSSRRSIPSWIANSCLSRTSCLVIITALSSMNTLWQTLSDSLPMSSTIPRRRLGEGDRIICDDDACDDCNASRKRMRISMK